MCNCQNKPSAVQIMPENTGEIRIFVAQFHSPSKGRVIREYADAVSPEDIAGFSPADRAKVQFFGLVNLGKEQLPENSRHDCSGQCATCKPAAS